MKLTNIFAFIFLYFNAYTITIYAIEYQYVDTINSEFINHITVNDATINLQNQQKLLANLDEQIQQSKKTNDYKKTIFLLRKTARFHFQIENYCLGQTYLLDAIKEIDKHPFSNDSLKKELQLESLDFYYKLRQFEELSLQIDNIKKSDNIKPTSFHNAKISYYEGFLTLETNSYEKAKVHFESAKHIFDSMGSQQELLQTQYALALLHFQQNNTNQAVHIALSCLEKENIYKENQLLSNIYKLLFEAHSRNKQYEKANHYLLLYKKNFIHILKKRSSIQNAQLTLLNETKQKMTAYQNNKNEQELKVENTINQRIFAAIMSIILSILAGIMYFIFKKKRSFSIALIGQQTELNQLNLNLQNSILKLEKSNFDLKHFSKIIAHDLNQPLLTIIGYSSIMLKNLKSNSKPSGIEEITRIHKYSTDMSNHITKLLQDSFPQIEREELKEKFKSIH
ncbi:MAG: hypothetical protein WBB17_13075 [Saprospiraceae bacterium]